MKSSTKAQIQSRMFIYILVAVIILLLLIFAFVSIKKARERAKEIEQKRLEQEIESSLQEIEYGSVERKQLNVPEGTKEMCFIDINKRTEVLTSPILRADKYTRMRSIIQSGEKKNIFFLLQKDPYLTAIYQAGICFDHYPYFACFEPKASILNLYIEGKGTCALIIVEYKICENMKGKYNVEDKTTEEIVFGSMYAKLTIPAGTKLTPAPEEICIEAVSYIGAEGLISEVYNITPTHITSSQNVSFDLKYEDFLLPLGADAGHIKIKKKSSPWEPLDNPTVQWDYSRVSGQTTELGYIAVFGPEPPNATIKVNDMVIPEGGEAIVPKGSDVIFDGTASTDPDGDIATYRWDLGDETTETDYIVTHQYSGLGSYNVTLTVTDETLYSKSSTITVTVVNDNNTKDIPDGSIIIISNPTSNWRNILSLVPVAMWKDKNGDHRIPYLVYHKEGTPSMTDFNMAGSAGIKKTFYPDKNEADINIALFTDETSLRNKETDGIYIKRMDSAQTLQDNYLKYWSKYEDLVVVGYNNQEDALMASLFAAFINAPIIFIDKDHSLPDLVIQGKIAHVVDFDDLDQFTKNYLGKAKEIKRYSKTDLKDPRKNQYQKLKSKIALTSIG